MSALGTGLLCLITSLIIMFNDQIFNISTGAVVGFAVIVKSMTTFEIGFNMPHAKVMNK